MRRRHGGPMAEKPPAAPGGARRLPVELYSWIIKTLQEFFYGAVNSYHSRSSILAGKSLNVRLSAYIVCAAALAAIAAPLAALAAAPPGPVQRGREVYLQRCFQCHGLEGKGDGTAAQYLPRRPRDFTDGRYKLKTSAPTSPMARDEDLYDAITDGMPSTGMPPWKKILSDRQRWDLVAYLKSLSDLFEGEENPPPLDYRGRIPPSPESVQRGVRAYFKLKCHECHGEQGQGPSIKKLKDDYGARIWPRDLTRPATFIGPFTPEAIYARITNGIPLTPMPGHVQHGERDRLEPLRWDVVNFVVYNAEMTERKRRRMRRIVLAVLLSVTVGGYLAYRSYLSKSTRA